MGDHNYNGRSFVDRDGWLARRATPRLKRARGIVIYEAKRGGKPLVLGINRMKRGLDANGMGRASLIKARHAYYTGA